jgi:putative tricarboxylic transport membrane protein
VRFNDAISGVFFVLFGIVLFVITRNFPTMPGQHYGADLFPRLIGSFMIGGGGVLIHKGLRQAHAVPWVSALDWMRSPRHVSNFILVIAVMIFYIVASDPLGFFLTGGISLFVLMAWLRGFPCWRSSLVIALLSTIVIQLFFGKLLRVPLPWGILQNYAW